MAEYGEWNRKGATLSDVTAKAEYSVSQDFIVKGIQTGKLEYRQGSVWGNPYLRVLRSQLEKYIAEEFGEDYLLRVKNQTELRRVKKELSDLKKRLEGLQKRKNELEASLGKGQITEPGAVRAKVNPRPWNWAKAHEMGCCYPVGEGR
jgi:hypothetical protein